MERNDYLRVTEVLRPFSGVELVPKHILDNAADRGTMVHKYIEGILTGFVFHVEHDKVTPYLQSFRRFWDQSKHTFERGKMTLEKRLYCDEWKITGQSDCIVETDGRTYVIDWKSAKKEHKSWRLQGACYRYLLEVNDYESPESVLFVKLDSNGGPPLLYKYEDTYAEDLEMFFNCLEVYKWFDMKKTRRN